jgi:hypothetical protein
MRFDPKLTPADDAAEPAGDLPEELALLGRALSDDAARLAGRYPAEHGLDAPAASAAARGRLATASTSAVSRRTVTRTAAAIALAAASIALAAYMGGLEYWKNGDYLRHGAPLADQGPARGIFDGGAVHDAAGAVQLVPAAGSDDPLPLRGAFFRELSRPQQEAVLDLLEEDALAQGSVSI